MSLGDSLQSPELWICHTVDKEVTLPPSCSQQVTEHWRGTGAGPFLPSVGLLQRAIFAQELPTGLPQLSQSCTVDGSSSYLSLLPSLSPSMCDRPELPSEAPPNLPCSVSSLSFVRFPLGNLLCASLHLAIFFLGAHTSSTEEKVSPNSDKEVEYSLCLGPRLPPSPPSPPSCQHMCWVPTSFQVFLLEQKIQTKTDEVPCSDGDLPFNWMDKYTKKKKKTTPR